MHIEKFTGGSYETIGYLVQDKKDAIIIDVPEHTAKKIADYIKNNKLKLILIIATHVHWDHIADAAKLSKITEAKFAIHRLDEENQAEINNIFEGEAGIIKCDKYVEEGDKIKTSGLNLIVLHTPGHTPGSICIYAEKEKILFSGDTLFSHTYGRVDFPLSNPGDMRESLHMLSRLPADTKVYPGHGAETTIGKEEWLKEV